MFFNKYFDIYITGNYLIYCRYNFRLYKRVKNMTSITFILYNLFFIILYNILVKLSTCLLRLKNFTDDISNEFSFAISSYFFAIQFIIFLISFILKTGNYSENY